MSSTNNFALLTRAHSLVAQKKRAKRDQLKEVIFDDAARREFLTGFHKRKLAKAEAARAKAKEREKQERLESRREQRQALREQAAQNAAQVEKAYGGVVEDEEWTGISVSDQDGKEHADEYEDEEVLATVTVVEDFDPDTIIHGPAKSDVPIPSSKPIPSQAKSSRLPPAKESPHAPSKKKSKPREKKIRYETKDARRREQIKQRRRRTEKAELAGGKASRKSKTPGGKRHTSKR
ncbi:Ribosomal RNA-processing protein 17 [Psilocybe cubensis]|uniref:Uncharacterized protein n=2 Tax=Psilocybe cubensis TaxID=181762 RepID=A0A8H7Y7B6_PSICU|nr:Ribosomal RNA-processing protein 17 [Psilocybe cubensis]KAH9485054.1 Ribosomal RNA-processing protein 17 [Psilocybe cubensis]